MDSPVPGQASRASALGDTWRFAALSVALTLLLAYPLSLDPAGRVLADAPDTRLFMWTLAWDTHAFTHQPRSIFEANIYYPERHTLAYSENLIGSGLIAAPILWLSDNPVLAMNVVALLSCILCGLGAYVLARRLGMGPPAAALCGIIFAFSPPRFFRLAQLHLTTIQWVPFGLASLHAYFDRGRKSDVRLALFFFTLQALTSGHGAVFLTLAMASLVLYRVVSGEPLAVSRRLKDVGVSGALLLVPALLILIPYRSVQVEMGLRRSPDDWMSNWSSFLASPSHVQTFLLSLVPTARINETAQAYLFPGYLPLILAAAAFLWAGLSRVRWGLRDGRAEGRIARRANAVCTSPSRRAGPFGPAKQAGSAGPGLHPSANGSRTWARMGVVLELAVLVSLAVSMFVTLVGPIRLKMGFAVLFSVRGAARPWLYFGVFALLRLAIARHAPFDIVTRLRRWPGALRRGWNARRNDSRTFYGLVTFVSVWLAAGPQGGLWPLVYWLPGLNFIRVPSRFSLLALLGVAVLAGMGFERLSASLAPKTRAVLATIVGGLLVVEFAAVPLGTSPYRVQIPAVDRWLAGQPRPFAVAELPLANPANLGAWERRHTEYMLHSMAHWQKTVEGYSGLRPPRHEELYSQLANFPDEKSLSSLAELGVDYVVVHTDLYAPGEWPRIEEKISRFQAWLRLEREDGAGRVYLLRAPTGGVTASPNR